MGHCAVNTLSFRQHQAILLSVPFHQLNKFYFKTLLVGSFCSRTDDCWRIISFSSILFFIYIYIIKNSVKISCIDQLIILFLTRSLPIVTTCMCDAWVFRADRLCVPTIFNYRPMQKWKTYLHTKYFVLWLLCSNTIQKWLMHFNKTATCICVFLWHTHWGACVIMMERAL